MGKTAIELDAAAEYLPPETLFRPDEEYPEYLFKGKISPVKNRIYSMVRKCFLSLGLDAENFGTKDWNPLGKYIKPGDKVVLKPNLVQDFNDSGGGTDCLYTNPGVTAAVLDYVLIALSGSGSVIVADAPVQTCDFDKLVKESGYERLIAFYRESGINVVLKDLRGLVSKDNRGIMRSEMKDNDGAVLVDLANQSAHSGLSSKAIKNMRITNYDPDELQRHHTMQKHEYLIAKDILEAQAVINIPKPKTHRKAGVTIALKNLVGVNVRKEYLPHHRVGNLSEGSDEFLSDSRLLFGRSRLLDIRNRLSNHGHYLKARLLNVIIKAANLVAMLFDRDNRLAEEGNWYGNDTIWRTILDLNAIVNYADRDGVMQKEKQRAIFNVADMIISGEGEGPLLPSPKRCGIIAAGENAVSFDEAVCALMGMDSKRVMSISSARGKEPYALDDGETLILSNNPEWNMKRPDEIGKEASLGFRASKGWVGHIELKG